MSRSMSVLAALAAGALAAGAAAAEAPQAEPPPPERLDDAAVMAWLSRYIQADGWTVLAADQEAVALGDATRMKLLPDQTLQAEIREEYFAPHRLGTLSTRSNLQVWNVDCRSPRVRILAMRVYPGNNLQGEGAEKENPQAAWSPVTPGTAPARAVEGVCRAAAGDAVGATPGR